MTILKKWMLLLVAAFGLLIAWSSVTYAKSKPIKSVGIVITGTVNAGDVVNHENLTVAAGSGGYTYDFYAMENTNEYWTAKDTPVMKVTLTANDEYAFVTVKKGLTVNVTGGEFVKAELMNNGASLLVTIKLPPLSDSVGPVRTINVENGVCSWEAAEGAAKYEVRLIRENTTIGGIQTTKELTFDASEYLVRPGNYHYEVRGVHKSGSDIVGPWAESAEFSVSNEQAAAQKEKNDAAQNAGTWESSGKKDSLIWKYKLEDGTYAKGWKNINYKRYYFNRKGVMLKGWQKLKDNWYYFDETDGYLWKNATTPDGYYVDFDGVWRST